MSLISIVESGQVGQLIVPSTCCGHEWVKVKQNKQSTTHYLVFGPCPRPGASGSVPPVCQEVWHTVLPAALLSRGECSLKTQEMRPEIAGMMAFLSAL